MRLPKSFHSMLDRIRLHALEVLDRRAGPSYMVTEKYTDQLVAELANKADAVWSEHLAHHKAVEAEAIEHSVKEFLEVYRRRPVLDNRGGSGFHNCFWLFIIARLLSPSLIVESGVWRGQTSWVLAAASPDAVLHGFDLDLRKVRTCGKTIFYHEMDWSQYDFREVDSMSSLCFFDCHVNQARRVREAYERGFKFLLFDDNAPAHKLAAYGVPGVPTIDMLKAAPLEAGEAIEWVWRGQRKRYVYDPADEQGARDLVDRYTVLPDVGCSTGFDGFSFLSLVELID